jgi:hypothetical protein
MTMNRLTLNALVACTILAVAPVAARADQPGHHPAYLHALTDLRHARAHIERRGGDLEMKWDEHTAVKEIDAAIHEIKEAAIDDGKNLEDHPPVDAKMDYAGRLHRGLELLHKAEKDCREEEDNNFAKGLQKRALKHIQEAIRFTEEGIANSHH